MMNAATYRSWGYGRKERETVDKDLNDPKVMLMERYGPMCNPTYQGAQLDLEGNATGEQEWLITLNGTRQIYVGVGFESGRVRIGGKRKISSDAHDYYTEAELEAIHHAKADLEELKFYIGVAFESEEIEYTEVSE